MRTSNGYIPKERTSITLDRGVKEFGKRRAKEKEMSFSFYVETLIKNWG